MFVDALGLGEALFGDHMAANMILLGAAYQAGAIPVRAAAIEEAIAINGVQVEMNAQAFRVGRLLVADPGWVRTIERSRAGAVGRARELGPEARALVDSVGAERRAAAAARGPGARADRLPGLGVRAPLRRLRPDGRRGGAGGGAGRDAARRGGGAPSPQADGLQGRVRGGAAPPPARGPRVDPGGDGRGQGALSAPPADPPGARHEAEGLARPVGRGGVPAAGRHAPSPGHRARSVRLREGPPGRAGARRRVPEAWSSARCETSVPSATSAPCGSRAFPTSSAATRTSSSGTSSASTKRRGPSAPRADASVARAHGPPPARGVRRSVRAPELFPDRLRPPPHPVHRERARAAPRGGAGYPALRPPEPGDRADASRGAALRLREADARAPDRGASGARPVPGPGHRHAPGGREHDSGRVRAAGRHRPLPRAAPSRRHHAPDLGHARDRPGGAGRPGRCGRRGGRPGQPRARGAGL